MITKERNSFVTIGSSEDPTLGITFENKSNYSLGYFSQPIEICHVCGYLCNHILSVGLCCKCNSLFRKNNVNCILCAVRN